MTSLVAGKAVNPNTYAPGWTLAEENGPMAVDQVSGGALVVDRVKDNSTDSITAVTITPSGETFLIATSNSATYVPTASFFVTDYKNVSVFPEQTSAPAGAVTVTYKLEWSFDNVNWFGDPIETVAAAGGGERIATVDIEVHTWDGNVSAAFKPLAAYGNRAVQGLYCRFSQKCSVAVAVTARYHFQLLG